MGEQIIQQILPSQAEQSEAIQCPCCSFAYSKWDFFLPTKVVIANDEQSGGEVIVSKSPFDALYELTEIARIQEMELHRHTCTTTYQTTTKESNINSNSNIIYQMVDTHAHPHLNTDRIEDYNNNSSASKSRNISTFPLHHLNLLSLTCAVAEADWQSCLTYASTHAPSVIPALGVHPWYVMGSSDGWLNKLETLLLEHPSAFVGEIGLCKCARELRHHPVGKQAVLQRQRDSFEQQMRLAAKLRRPVTVHCVQQMGPMMEILKGILKEATNGNIGDPISCFPPAIAFHSFTGVSDHVKRILELEEALYDHIKARPEERPPICYFGFSHLVNFIMCSRSSEKSARKVRDAIRSVPLDRILAESDVPTSEDMRLGTAGSIAFIASVREMSLDCVAKLTAVNGLTFFRSLGRI